MRGDGHSRTADDLPPLPAEGLTYRLGTISAAIAATSMPVIVVGGLVALVISLPDAGPAPPEPSDPYAVYTGLFVLVWIGLMVYLAYYHWAQYARARVTLTNAGVTVQQWRGRPTTMAWSDISRVSWLVMWSLPLTWCRITLSTPGAVAGRGRLHLMRGCWPYGRECAEWVALLDQLVARAGLVAVVDPARPGARRVLRAMGHNDRVWRKPSEEAAAVSSYADDIAETGVSAYRQQSAGDVQIIIAGVSVSFWLGWRLLALVSEHARRGAPLAAAGQHPTLFWLLLGGSIVAAASAVRAFMSYRNTGVLVGDASLTLRNWLGQASVVMWSEITGLRWVWELEERKRNRLAIILELDGLPEGEAGTVLDRTTAIDSPGATEWIELRDRIIERAGLREVKDPPPLPGAPASSSGQGEERLWRRP
jgi:hypothetical protein